MPTEISNHLFYQIPKIAFDNPQLSNNDKAVLAVLYDVIREKGRAAHRNETIAKLANISLRTVARCLNNLEALGFIIRTGLSFTRKFILGALFEYSKALYKKMKQDKKNLRSSAKSTKDPRQVGKHTKTLPINNIDGFSLEELQLIAWYKKNPNMHIRAEDKYLFENK